MPDKSTLTIEMKPEERRQLEELARQRGYNTLAEYVHAVIKNVLTEQEELEHILATVPPEKVIAHIEELNPDWKHDLLPWKLARPGEKIPWQAVYSIKHHPASPEGIAWAERRLAELKATGDVP